MVLRILCRFQLLQPGVRNCLAATFDGYFWVTTALVSIVVSMFMAGLGLGPWGAGILVRRSGAVAPSLLRWYGSAELLIGILALLVPYELKWGRILLQP